MFTRAGTLLTSFTRQSKISGAVNAILVRQTFEKVLRAECADLPEEVLKNIKAVSIKSGVLTVSCPRLVAVELSMRSDGLIKGVGEQLGKNVVKRLKFK